MGKGKRAYLLLACLLLLTHFTHGQDTLKEEYRIPDEEVYEEVVKVPNHELLQQQSPNPVVARTVDAQKLENIRRDEAYWYANHTFSKKQKAAATSSRNWVDIVFWILLTVGALAIIGWFLASGNLRLFRKQSTALDTLPAEGTEDIYELNFESSIRDAVAAGNYRLAVRLHYLQLLKLLADKNLIRYTQDQTNSHYLLQLAGTKWHPEFFKLTRHFEYIWYGKFPLTPVGYEQLRQDFDHFKNHIV